MPLYGATSPPLAFVTLRHSFFVAILVALGGLAALPGQAQPATPAASPDSSEAPLIDAVQFTGDDRFDDELLRTLVRTRPNRRFLDVPGLTWWRWLYGIGESGTFGDRISQGFLAIGEPPAYVDAALVAADAERVAALYRQEGFRDATVEPRIEPGHRAGHVVVTFVITPGPATFIHQVVYDGLSALDLDQQHRLARSSVLEHHPVDPAEPLHFVADNQRYSEPLLLEERRRLLAFLRRSGFAAIGRDSIRAVVFPQQPDSFDVTFRIRPGPRFRFGDVTFDVTGPDVRAAVRRDSAGAFSWTMTGESRLDADLLHRSLRFAPGEVFDQQALLATKRRLEATGIFTFTDITSVFADTLTLPGDSLPRLPHRITLRTRRRHQLRFETFMLQRSVVLAGSDTELGTGAGIAYENLNLLGSGEALTVRTAGSFAANIDSTLFNSAQAEISTALTMPYLIRPFGGLDRRLGLYQSRTRLSLSLLTARRNDLGLIIRGRGTARARLELQHTPTIASLVDLIDLSLSNPDTTRVFETAFLSQLPPEDSLSVTDRIQRAQILEDYTQPQINSALRYTFRSVNVNPLRRERGYSYEAAAEVGGNLPYLLDRLAFTPDTTESTIPGLPFFEGDGGDLLYRRYVRAAIDLRRYRPLSPTTVLAWKFLGGVAHPLGQANLVPFDRRFYTGGGTSVRGWRPRELGPGAARFGSGGANVLGGDVKLETSLELRSTLLRNVFAADWIAAAFADAGNVWFGPRNPGFPGLEPGEPDGIFAIDRFYREVGIGGGAGLRLAWEYLIVRFDLAYRLFDPSMPQDAFPQPFRKPTPYFGIGHTF